MIVREINLDDELKVMNDRVTRDVQGKLSFGF